MKKLIALSMIFAAVSFTVTAQEKKEPGKDHDMKMEHHPPMVMKDMNFSEAQKAQMNVIREDTKKQLDLLKQNQNQTVKEFNDRKEAIMKAQKEKMQAVFTPEQKAKLQQGKAQMEEKRKEHMDKQMDKMKDRLLLTDDQTKQIKAIHANLEAKTKAIRDDASLNQESRKQKVEALRKEAEEQRDKLLTPDQKLKLEAMRKERQDKAHDKDQDKKEVKP